MQVINTVITRRNSRLDKATLRMNADMGEEYGFKEGDEISLSAGRLSIPVKLNFMPLTTEDGMEISLEVQKRLHISAPTSYAICINNQEMHLGPVVGIMADSCNDADRPYKSQSTYIAELINYGTVMGQICFAFDAGSVNFKQKTINGYSYGKKGWKKGVFPMPDVVYPREGGSSKLKLQTRRRMQSLGCKFINPSVIGKWANHKILAQNPDLKSYIPNTCLVTNFFQVGRMLAKYGAVYLKPINGSRGRNIIRVVKRPKSKLYDYQYQAKSHPRIGTANGLNSLRNKLTRFMGRRGYIVQRRINLLRVHGNIVDVRVLVQKDESGQWLVTGKACRVGKKGSITSNISSGGYASKVATVVSEYFRDPMLSEKILTEIDYLAIASAQVLEAKTSSMGELGIDIGIDSTGKLWFIEANLRPARRVFSLIHETSIREDSIQRPLLYARYLAGFSQER